MPFLLKWQSIFRNSSRESLEDLNCPYCSSSSTSMILALNYFDYLFPSYYYYIFSPSYSFSIYYYLSSTSILPSSAAKSLSPQLLSNLVDCCLKISTTFLCLKAAARVLFFRMKQIRSNPSHSRKSMSGSGFFGSILTILLSTLGGGLKLFLPTLIRWSTLAKSCTFTLRRQQRSDPGLAMSLCANYFWNMRTAHLKIGFCASSLKTSGELIWQGMFATQISKKGSSTARTSPGINRNLLACSEYLNLLESSATIRGSISIAITFFAFSSKRAVRLPVPGPISRTTSVGRIEDFTTISLRMWELIRMCCPQDLLNIIPVLFTVCFYLIIVVVVLQLYNRKALFDLCSPARFSSDLLRRRWGLIFLFYLLHLA